MRRFFGTVYEIDPLRHVRHQAAFEAHVDQAVSRLATIPAARAGRVLFFRTLPRVFAGDALAFLLVVP